MDRGLRRHLAFGGVVLAVAAATGIAASFCTWDRGSPFDVSKWSDCNPLGRATYGPLLLVFWLCPLTAPVLFFLGLSLYAGAKWKRARFLLPVTFLVIGTLWVLWVAYISSDPID